MSEESLPKFLRLSTKIVRIMLEDEDIDQIDPSNKVVVGEKTYDVLNCSSNACEHLMDRVEKLSAPG